MRMYASITAIFVSVAVPLTVRAQAPVALDSSQLMSMMANAMEMNKPAKFVLRHRSELALSAPQVTRLESLVLAQADSVNARQARRLAQLRQSPPSASSVDFSRWSGDVDERALRDAACRSSVAQAEIMVGLARDRRAAAAVLTPAQRDQLPRLEASDRMAAMKRP